MQKTMATTTLDELPAAEAMPRRAPRVVIIGAGFGGLYAAKRLRGEAVAVRSHIIQSFERASLSNDTEEQRRLMTIVDVGGGPTGVETAGALAELKRHVLPRDYPELDLSQARVILIEATDRLLLAFP